MSQKATSVETKLHILSYDHGLKTEFHISCSNLPKTILDFAKLFILPEILPQPSNLFTRIYPPYPWHFATLVLLESRNVECQKNYIFFFFLRLFPMKFDLIQFVTEGFLWILTRVKEKSDWDKYFPIFVHNCWKQCKYFWHPQLNFFSILDIQ